MPDGHLATELPSFPADPRASPAYVPPASLVLEGLGITEMDLARGQVTVSSAFLRFMLQELARGMPFDAVHYRAANPDVEAAWLAGDIASLAEHFAQQGWLERRQPHRLPVDAGYYGDAYGDLAEAFRPGDWQGLERHFRHHGWHEGRAGVAWQRDAADRWILALRSAAAADAAHEARAARMGKRAGADA